MVMEGDRVATATHVDGDQLASRIVHKVIQQPILPYPLESRREMFLEECFGIGTGPQ